MYHLIFVVKIKNNMNICIIGAGLSSLTLAKAFVNQNIYVDILVSNKPNKPNTSRTIGISKNNIEFFNNHIINIEKIIWNLNEIDIFTDNLKKDKLINFKNKKKTLFSIIKNNELYKILEKSLLKNKYFKKVHQSKNLNFINKYDLVINTDHGNLITKKFFNKKISKKYNSTAYTSILKHDKILNNVATQIFTKNGPLAFLPISNNETSIVYSQHNSRKKEKENIEDLIRQYNFKYKIQKMQKFQSFELKSFHLRSYYQDNILAFGDLLHRIHPLAGQGFNMTIRDIKTLIDIVNKRVNLGLPIDSSVNRDFEKKTKHKNYIFSNGIDLVHEFFNLERKLDNNIISQAAQIFGKNPYLNKLLIKIADQGIIN